MKRTLRQMLVSELSRSPRKLTLRTIKKSAIALAIYLLYIAASTAYLIYGLNYPSRPIGEWAISMSLFGLVMVGIGLAMNQFVYWNWHRKHQVSVK